MMNLDVTLSIIGIMQSPFKQKFGIPRQPNLINTISYITMLPPYDDMNGFKQLEQFSHIWLLWQFNDNKRKNNAEDYVPLIRPPRLGGNQKIGVFASRSMYRPSPIGLSVVQFVEVKRINNETRVYVKGADLLDGTPILDIKPYLNYADAIYDAQSGYAQQAPQSLAIVWADKATQQKNALFSQQILSENDLTEMMQVLALNPQPAYQKNSDKIYGLSYGDYNLKFSVYADKVEIISITYLSE